MKAMDSKPYEKERKKDIYRIFKKYDRTNKGYINLKDLKEISKEVQEEVDEETMKLMI
jgi:centrin-1